MRIFRPLLVSSFVACSFFAVACSSSSGASSVADEQDLTAAWFAQNLPPGSPLEKGVLALLNDRSMSEDEYVEQCNMSKASAINIVNYRNGDEPADSVDDELFETIAEADRMPFTDKGFWLAAKACAQKSYVPSNTGGTCATGTSKIMQSGLALQLVVDESGSMSGDKWKAASAAVGALVDDLAAKADPDVQLGLILFDDAVNTQFAPAVVTPAHAALLKNAVLKSQPGGGGTATLDALQNAYPAIEGTSPPSATKAVILLTDGVPNGGQEEQTKIEQLVAAKAGSVQLFALGVGGFPSADSFGYDPAFVGRLAVAGGTRASAACDPASKVETNLCHFQITPGKKPAATIATEISTALARVRTNIAACDIGLQQTGLGAIDGAKVKVVVTDANGKDKAVPADAANGWSLDDTTNPTKVLLRGTACLDLRANAAQSARVTLGCK